MKPDNPYSSPSAEPAIERPVAELEPPQSVKYQITVEDIESVSEKLCDSMPTFQRLIKRRQWAYFFAAAFFLLFAALTVAVNLELLAFWLCIVSLFLFVAALRLPKNTRRSTSRFNKEMMANESAYLLDKTYKATLFDEGIQMEDEEGHWFRKWEAIPRVDVTDILLIVSTTHASAHGIPSRAFFDEVAFNGFCQLAERLWREAQDDAEPFTH